MVRITKVTTRAGDGGYTTLARGVRIRKDSIKIASIGEIDTLNAYIGMVSDVIKGRRMKDVSGMLSCIQQELFDLGAYLSLSNRMRISQSVHFTTIERENVEQLEKWCNKLNSELTPLNSFIIPGGAYEVSLVHVARVTCRTAERTLVTLSRKERLSRYVLPYINRLSDLLFIIARVLAKRCNVTEVLWKPRKKSSHQ